jgi:hypothetical protein
MTTATVFPDGGYRYVPGVFQYSAGVAAEPGFAIERARFARVVPLDEGFARIEAHLKSIGRPVTAFCACELRSPAPFSEQGFVDFNRIYVGTLERWNVMRNGVNPVARSNVCPEIDPPAAPGFYAFSYTVPATAGGGLVVAGSGEAPEGHKDYRSVTVRAGETSADAILEKARWVLGEQERRLAALGATWRDVTATHVYTVHDIHPFLGSELVRRGAAAGGVTWQYCRPPVAGLEYEMDCRGVGREIVI